MLSELDFKWLFYLHLNGPQTRDHLMIMGAKMTGKRPYNKLPRLLRLGLVGATELGLFDLTPAGQAALKGQG